MDVFISIMLDYVCCSIAIATRGYTIMQQVMETSKACRSCYSGPYRIARATRRQLPLDRA